MYVYCSPGFAAVSSAVGARSLRACLTYDPGAAIPIVDQTTTKQTEDKKDNRNILVQLLLLLLHKREKGGLVSHTDTNRNIKLHV